MVQSFAGWRRVGNLEAKAEESTEKLKEEVTAGTEPWGFQFSFFFFLSNKSVLTKKIMGSCVYISECGSATPVDL